VFRLVARFELVERSKRVVGAARSSRRPTSDDDDMHLAGSATVGRRPIDCGFDDRLIYVLKLSLLFTLLKPVWQQRAAILED